MIRFMSDKIMPMSEAVEGYDLFDKMKVQKGILPILNVNGFGWAYKQ